MDADGSRTIDLWELLEACGHRRLRAPDVAGLLARCGYGDRALRLVLRKAGLPPPPPPPAT